MHPGGGGTEHLPHLVGRGRALEVVLGANDFDGDTAERYGYLIRALPDAKLNGFVERLRAGSPPSTGAPGGGKISSTRSRCHPPTGSSTRSPPLRPR